MLLRLSNEEKMMGIGSLIVLASAFMPWYSVVFNYNEKGVTESGFSGDLGVIGFSVFLLTGLSLAYLLSDHLNLKLPNFNYKKEQIILLLSGESAYLLLMTLAIYTKRSFDYTNAELRFGLYTALIGAIISTFAVFAQIQRKEKKNVEAFFSHTEEVAETEDLTEETVNAVTKEPANEDKFYYEEQKKEEVIAKPEVAKQESFFEEAEAKEEIVAKPAAEPTAEPAEVNEGTEAGEGAEASERIEVENEVEEVTTKPEIAEADEEQTSKDDLVKDSFVQVEKKEGGMDMAQAAEENLAETNIKKEVTVADTKENETRSDQKDFFAKEAGINRPTSEIKVDMDSVKRVDQKPEVETSDKKEVAKDDSDFYSDL